MLEKNVNRAPFLDAAISLFLKKAEDSLKSEEAELEKKVLSQEKRSTVLSSASSSSKEKSYSSIKHESRTEALSTILEKNYELECQRINKSYHELLSVSPCQEIPYFYFRKLSCRSDSLSSQLLDTTKSVEIVMEYQNFENVSFVEDFCKFISFPYDNQTWDLKEFFEIILSGVQSRSGLAALTMLTGLPSRMKLFDFNADHLFHNKSNGESILKEKIDHRLSDDGSTNTSEFSSVVHCEEESDMDDVQSDSLDSSFALSLLDFWIKKEESEGLIKRSNQCKTKDPDLKKERIASIIESSFPTSHNTAKRKNKKKEIEHLFSMYIRSRLSKEDVNEKQKCNTQLTSAKIANVFGSPDNTLEIEQNDKKKIALPNCSLLNLFSALTRTDDYFLLPAPMIDRPLHPVYVCSTVSNPRNSMEFFPLELGTSQKSLRTSVEIFYLFLSVKKNLLSSELRLMALDSNCDGRLSEDEVERYIQEQVVPWAKDSGITEEMVPFYCCVVSRFVFWHLDKSNRSSVSIDALLTSDALQKLSLLEYEAPSSSEMFAGVYETRALYDKFLTLDTRSRGTLQADDLKRYKKGLVSLQNDGLPPDTSPLSSLFVDRYFETTILMVDNEMDFRKFVDFVIAVEMLPQCSRPLFFWNILNIEDTGMLTPMVVNSFFRETHSKVEAVVSTISSKDVVIPELFDMIAPVQPMCITRDEFLAAPQAGLFTSIIIDSLAFWEHEYRPRK